MLIISRVAHTPCLHIQHNLRQLHLYIMASYWHLQIQPVVSNYLIMHKSAFAHNNEVIYGTSTKKQSHENLGRGQAPKMLYPQEIR